MSLDESITNQTTVSLRIAKHVLLNELEENVVFSPLSLQVVLGIIAAGSEGPAQQQLLDFLRFKSTDHLNSFVSHLLSVILKDTTPSCWPCLSFLKGAAPVRLSLASGVWVDRSFSLQPSFKEILSSNYKATLSSVDFINNADKVVGKVNLWAKKQTKGLISDVLSPESVDNLTRLIFANALYFKGVWEEPFDASETEDYDFYLLDDSSVKVPFMTSDEKQFVGAFDGFKVLCLPYKQGVDEERQFSMCFFLPDAKDGLVTLIEKMASEPEFLKHNLPKSMVKVGDFRIPKFEISFGFTASDALKKLGVVLPFSPSASLTKMVVSPDPPIWVSDIFQKCFIKVNEKGTEAAAVTISLACGSSWSTRKPIDFVADHPFLFMIREDFSGTILFVGQVVNPLVR